MAPYTISYFGPEGELIERKDESFEHDDHALDRVGLSSHPHAIHVHQGDRLVARFPPWDG